MPKTITASLPIKDEYLSNIADASNYDAYKTQTEANNARAEALNETIDSQIENTEDEDLKLQLEGRKAEIVDVQTKDEFAYNIVHSEIIRALSKMNSRVTDHLKNIATAPIEETASEAEATLKENLSVTIE